MTATSTRAWSTRRPRLLALNLRLMQPLLVAESAVESAFDKRSVRRRLSIVSLLLRMCSRSLCACKQVEKWSIEMLKDSENC